MTARTYATPAAFKAALDQRLRDADPGQMVRRRQLLVFDRLLARVIDVLGDAALLKGGLALERRIQQARATKDVDLRVTGAPEQLRSRLQAAGRHDLGDFMAFEVVPDREHPTIDNDGVRYQGQRFRATCMLAGKPYGSPFGIDVGFGDPITGEPDLMTADDVLGFAGVPPPRLRLYPIETHVAEKLHAYTLPRLRPNSRVKDLPDLALLATIRPLDAARLRAALAQTFGFRATHGLPPRLPDPPAAWALPYATMARSDRLPWPTLAEVLRAAGGFVDPVLAGVTRATWSPAAWSWQA